VAVSRRPLGHSHGNFDVPSLMTEFSPAVTCAGRGVHLPLLSARCLEKIPYSANASAGSILITHSHLKDTL
jgi:hypothetical protein